MRTFIFAGRNSKEILRDKLSLFFGIGFPVVLLLLMTAIQHNVPVDLFQLETLTPGIVVFGFAFLSLFSATLISRDRASAFMIRLYASPMTPADFILGYFLPLIPMALVQTSVCYLVALCLGMSPSIHVLSAVVFSLPAALIFIGLGLLCGTVLNDKQVGGVCGALLTNLTAWLSGAWFDLNLIGGVFKRIAYLLPFAHATDMGRAVLQGDYAGIFPHFWVVLGYAVALTGAAVFTFSRKMRTDA